MVTFGTTVGFGASTLSKKIGPSLLPIVGVMFIVGAGGGFKQDAGRRRHRHGDRQDRAIASGLSTLLLGWIVAVLIRLATGSATVATVTAAGIIAPLRSGLSPAQLALVVLGVGAGSLFFSHVNDAGFWLVQGVLRADRRSDDQDLVGDGDHHLGDGADTDVPSIVGRVTRLGDRFS